MRNIVEDTEYQLRSLGVFEGAVTPEYIEGDVDKALKAAHIERADVSVEQKGSTIHVSMRCRQGDALKEAGANVIKHLEGEQVPTSNASFKEVGDGFWEFTFDAEVVEPVH